VFQRRALPMVLIRVVKGRNLLYCDCPCGGDDETRKETKMSLHAANISWWIFRASTLAVELFVFYHLIRFLIRRL
jgi:hypothetical protein